MSENPKQGWWGRNWKWVVPVGCLGLVVLSLAFVAGLLFLIFGIVKSSDAYKGAVAQCNDRVGQARLECGQCIQRQRFYCQFLFDSRCSLWIDLPPALKHAGRVQP